MRELRALSAGVALVMYTANGISIQAGKGNNWPCVIFGITATVIYFVLMIVYQREIRRR